MLLTKKGGVTAITLFFSFSILVGFITNAHAGLFGWNGSSRPERNVASFEKEGRNWGERLKGRKPGELDDDFVNALKDPERIDFFNVHSDLKEAFKKGFRMGYEDRIADLILGPHLTAAAGRIGNETSDRFVKVINAFEQGWADTIRNAINVFIVLISEGSQADRETFIENFTNVYSQKWRSTQEILKGHNIMTQQSEGGTMLFLDYSKGKTLGALDIPAPLALKTEIYHQTFKVMGDEWGRRLSTNLIRRDELIELLRRCKTALEEVKPGLAGNLGIIRDAFVKKESYGTDAENVFAGLIKAAGYSETPISTQMMEAPRAKNGQAMAEDEQAVKKGQSKKKK
jgi:hypothetical protein